MALHRSSQLLAALTILAVITWLGWSFRRIDNVQTQPLTTQPNEQESAQADGPTPDVPLPDTLPLLDSLCYYGVCHISPDAVITYGKVDIVAIETSTFKAPLLQNLSSTLPSLEALSPQDVLSKSRPANRQITVKIPPIPSPPDASNLILGVATNVDRLKDSLDQFSHWASNNGARIVALLPNSTTNESISATMTKSRHLKLDLLILTNEMEFDDRYFHLGTLMHTHSKPSTTWAVFIDDDTFFPSLAALQALLDKYPSPATNPYYVGAISEDFHQLFKWGFMAYGGGGVFVSKALLSQLQPHLPKCATTHNTGDARLAQCIFKQTTTKLTFGEGLFQIDLWGDATGFYEGLRPQPVSVHHWKSWNKFDMVNISRVSTICGDSCIFQKFRFDDSVQLTNGFSIVKYSDYIPNESDMGMEKTWLDSAGGSDDMFLHSLAPLRPRDEHKIQYLLEGSIVEDKCVRQFYVRRTTEEKEVTRGGKSEGQGEGDEKKEKEKEKEKRPVVEIIEVAWRAARTGVV